jgi:hypothetical protein
MKSSLQTIITSKFNPKKFVYGDNNLKNNTLRSKKSFFSSFRSPIKGILSALIFSLSSLSLSAQQSLNMTGSVGLHIGNTTVHAAGDVNIGASGVLSFQGSGTSTLRIVGNFTSSGTFTCGTGTVQLVGTAAQNIPAHTYYNLTLNNTTTPATSAASLSGNANVGGTLTLTSGILNTGANTIDLGANGAISESNPSAIAPTSYVTGYVKATRNTGSTSGAVSFGGIGLSMTETSKTNNSTVVIRRTGTASVGAGNNSILRYYDITPAVDNAMSGTIVFSYTTAELNGQAEDSLKIYKSTDGGTTWSKQASTVNTAANTLTLSGITSFSRWTASNKVSAPLPVEFLTFKATLKEKTGHLTWQTATELNNDYFVIERSTDTRNWVSLDTVKGAGNSNAILNYNYIDEKPLSGISYYRLKQVDFDKNFSYSNIETINFEGFEIVELFPNPSNGDFSVVIQSTIETVASFTMYSTTGQVVKTETLQINKGLNYLQKQFRGAMGKYFITVKTNDGKYNTFDFILIK